MTRPGGDRPSSARAPAEKEKPVAFLSTFTLALVGNPNAGKTTLFNALTGLRAKTANFPGTTVERRIGRATFGSRPVQIVDLPGLYSLKTGALDARLTRDALLGELDGLARPDAILVVVDATNLERNLFLATEVIELDLPVVVALTMIDMAERDGLAVDARRLSELLGCPVLPVSAISGQGLDALKAAVGDVVKVTDSGATAQLDLVAGASAACASCRGCGASERFDWSERVARAATRVSGRSSGRTDRLDAFLTHPLFGTLSFLGVMTALFSLIFWAAQIPMDLIDGLFASIGARVASVLPEGDLRSLVVDGVIGGVGGVLVFLPQIAILFFALALLEDTGYLARAALVMDRVMRRLGLPGKAFVPLLSAHACAVPAIMSTRVIESPRDRLLTILVAPLLTCSARIPVYAMVAALVFPSSPLRASALFVSAYALGLIAALLSALAFARTVARGGAQPLVLELPPYRAPQLRTALLHTWDRASVFVQQAGTIILLVSLTLWALSNYPRAEVPRDVSVLLEEASVRESSGDLTGAVAVSDAAERLAAQHRLRHSAAGAIGRAIEPLIEPLGYDWQIGIGILSSFVAREVIVSTLAIVYGVGEAGSETADDGSNSLYDALRRASRSDGSPVFGLATSVSLLVFYVLAAQCFSTTAVVRRETGSWSWAIFQILYMTSLAWVAAFLTYQGLRAAGFP